MTKRVLWSPDRPKRPDIDPMLDALRNALRTDDRSYLAKANVSGLAPLTIKRIEVGITKRPTSITVQMAYKMLGYELRPVRVKR